MKTQLLCKRYYTNKDLIQDRFGRLYHLPAQLRKLGLNIEVTAMDYRHFFRKQIKIDGVHFCSLPVNPIRLADSMFKLFQILKANRPDLMMASGDSHIGYLGLFLARRFGIPMVFDVYDYYPAFASNRIPGMKTLFRKSVEGADLVLCASTPLMARLAGLNRNILRIENGVDRHLFRPQSQVEARAKFGIKPRVPLVGYFGSIQPARGPLLIEACQRLRARDLPALELMLAGSVSGVAIDAPWIRYRGQVEQSVIPGLIAVCDVVVIPYADDAFNSMSGACKIAEYLSCGKPVVASDIAGHREIFRNAPQSLCRPEPADMAEAIRRQLARPQVAPFPETLEWHGIARTLLSALANLTTAQASV